MLLNTMGAAAAVLVLHILCTIQALPLDVEREQVEYLIRAFTSLSMPAGSGPCESIRHCNALLQRCDLTTRLCTAKDQPEFPTRIDNGKGPRQSCVCNKWTL